MLMFLRATASSSTSSMLQVIEFADLLCLVAIECFIALSVNVKYRCLVNSGSADEGCAGAKVISLLIQRRTATRQLSCAVLLIIPHPGSNQLRSSCAIETVTVRSG